MERNKHILPAWHTASAVAMTRLPALVHALYERHGAMPYLGCELEWYVDQPDNERIIAEVHAAVERDAERHHIRMTPIKPEKGHGQYEVGFDASNNPLAMVQAIHDFRALLTEKAAKRGLHILWDAKPHADDYGSALQAHVHLEDAAGQRLYVKKDAYLSPALAHSIGGLLAITPAATFVAAPQPADYARFVPRFDAPVNVSWGGNNRSVALRLPLKTGSSCHIEYRLAGADADPACVFALLLVGVLHGLEEKLHPGEQMHGVASDAQYTLPPLPKDHAEAERAFSECAAMRRWIGDEWCSLVLEL